LAVSSGFSAFGAQATRHNNPTNPIINFWIFI
jgi:hypothetical protein